MMRFGDATIRAQVLTFGVQGLSGSGSAVAPSGSQAYGVVGPGTLDPDTAGTPGTRTAPAADAAPVHGQYSR